MSAVACNSCGGRERLRTATGEVRGVALKDWTSVERFVRPAFERIDAAVRERAPNIAGGILPTTPSPRRQFEIQAGYMWDSQREFEDLLITMEYVVIDERMRRHVEVSANLPTNARGWLRFEIERGTGESLRDLERVWLTTGSDDPLFWEAVTHFAHQVKQLLNDSTQFILNELEAAR
jgi:hypothetical protein